MKNRFLSIIIVTGILGVVLGNSKCYAQVPSQPLGLYTVALDGEVELNWDANAAADNVVQYTIYRSLDNISFDMLSNVPASASTQFNDMDLQNGLSYFYQVTATNGNGESTPSDEDAAVPAEGFGKFAAFNSDMGDSLVFENSDELQLASQSFTIEFWMRVSKYPAMDDEGNLVSRFSASGTDAYVIGILDDGELFFRVTQTSTLSFSTIERIEEDRWYHVAVVFEANVSPPIALDVQIYIDGIQATKDSTPTLPVVQGSVGGSLVIGADINTNARFFDGYMDELRIWDGALSQATIQNNMCQKMRGDEPGLLGLWHFDGTSPSGSPAIYDYSLNGNNGGDGIVIQNFKPDAVDDFNLINAGNTAVLDVQDNDTGFSNTPLVTSVLANYPISGTSSISPNNEISYQPAAGLGGVDTIKYVLADTASFCGSLPKYDTATAIVYVACNDKNSFDWNEIPDGADPRPNAQRKEGFRFAFSSSGSSTLSQLETAGSIQGTQSLVWEQDVASNSESNELYLSFNRPVFQLCLNLLDIDANTGDFEDQVVVDGFLEGSKVTLSVNEVTLGSSVNYGGNNIFTGLNLVNDASLDGNAEICFFTPIDSLTITFGNGPGAPADPAAQNLGIGNFSWCTFPNNPPEVFDEDNNPVIDTVTIVTDINVPVELCLNVEVGDAEQASFEEIVAIDGNGSLTGTTSPLFCLDYNPETDFVGTEYFNVTVCNDRTPQACRTVIVEAIVGDVNTNPGEFFISQAVSPNGDGILDTWEIVGIEEFGNNQIKVFNVWGDLVFEKSNYNNTLTGSWYGQNNASGSNGTKPVADGTYYYIIDLGDGSNILTGYVVLKR